MTGAVIEEPPTGAYIGRAPSSILLGWVAPLISAGAGEIFDGWHGSRRGGTRSIHGRM
jgi:hypothetical protein